VEFSGGVCGGVRSVRDSRLARVAVLSIVIERVLEGIYAPCFDTLQTRFDDLLSGADGAASIVIFLTIVLPFGLRHQPSTRTRWVMMETRQHRRPLAMSCSLSCPKMAYRGTRRHIC
jgi:hypothetical protein